MFLGDLGPFSSRVLYTQNPWKQNSGTEVGIAQSTVRCSYPQKIQVEWKKLCHN